MKFLLLKLWTGLWTLKLWTPFKNVHHIDLMLHVHVLGGKMHIKYEVSIIKTVDRRTIHG